jgi:hypothetical protein
MMSEREYQRRLAPLLEELQRAKTQKQKDAVEKKMQALDRQANGSQLDYTANPRKPPGSHRSGGFLLHKYLSPFNITRQETILTFYNTSSNFLHSSAHKSKSDISLAFAKEFKTHTTPPQLPPTTPPALPPMRTAGACGDEQNAA